MGSSPRDNRLSFRTKYCGSRTLVTAAIRPEAFRASHVPPAWRSRPERIGGSALFSWCQDIGWAGLSRNSSRFEKRIKGKLVDGEML